MIKFWYIKNYLKDEGIDPNNPWDYIGWDGLDLYFNITRPGHQPETGDKVVHISPTLDPHVMALEYYNMKFGEWPLSKLGEKVYQQTIKGIFEHD